MSVTPWDESLDLTAGDHNLEVRCPVPGKPVEAGPVEWVETRDQADPIAPADDIDLDWDSPPDPVADQSWEAREAARLVQQAEAHVRTAERLLAMARLLWAMDAPAA